MASNENMLLITMTSRLQGLNTFTITGRDWIKLEKWMSHYDLDNYEETCDISYYVIARNITPKQREKFANYYELEEAKENILYLVYDNDREEWLEHKLGIEKYYEKQKAKEVLEELEIDKFNPRSVGGKLDFNRRAEEDGIVWKEEEEMNECEICGCNMTEENTRYVEDSDTIIMCDKCEE
tara:strand:+ start:701 stop:1243 length:543 start_codon:yes stop_codon:yes gene_type:complete